MSKDDFKNSGEVPGRQLSQESVMQSWGPQFDSQIPPNPKSWKGKAGKSLSSLDSQLAYLASSSPMRGPVSKNKVDGSWGTPPEVNLWPIHMQACTDFQVSLFSVIHLWKLNVHLFMPSTPPKSHGHPPKGRTLAERSISLLPCQES